MKYFYFIVISLVITNTVYTQTKFNLNNYKQFPKENFSNLNKSNSSGSWSDDFTVPGVIKGIVYTMTSDGINLYVGGDFTTAGSEIAYNIVKWDGSSWSSIGEGLENGVNGSVYALTAIDGKLFVGGNFTKAGSLEVNGIALWYNGEWHSLGQDSINGVRSAQRTVTGEIIVVPGIVYSMKNYNDMIVFGGFFNIIGSDTASGVGGWNLVTEEWEVFNNGLSNLDPEDPPYAYSLIQKNNDLYVGGKFIKAGGVPAKGFAKWDGQQWNEVGEGVNGWIRDMKLDLDGNIYLVGSFDTVGNIHSSGIAKWDGSIWQQVGGGIEPLAGSIIPDVRSIEIINNEIYVTGSFTLAGSTGVSSLAKWNGNTWMSPGSGLIVSQVSFPGTGTSLQKVNSDLYIGGYFTEADDQLFSNIIRWNTQTSTFNKLSDGSSELGVYDGHLFSIAQNNNKIYVGGNFSIVGGTKASNIALLEDESWHSLNEGINGVIYTICADSSNVYVGGSFGEAGTTTAYHIARWNGNEWSSIGIGVGGVSNPSVNVIKKKDNYLYVGGHFAIVGDSTNSNLTANSIARFNLLNDTWQNISNGVELFPGTPGYVNDIEFDGDSMYVGGQFYSVDNRSVNSLVMFINNNWVFVGDSIDNGVNGIVYTIKNIEGSLYIGGEFERPGVGNTISLVKWNGIDWGEVNGGIYYDNPFGVYPAVTDIEYLDGNLFVSGIFNKAGTKQVNNVASYNGIEWDDMNGGTNFYPVDIDASSKKIIFGGSFTFVGNNPSSSIAIYDILTSIDYHDTQNKVTDYYLGQNYPNPFNPTTTIKFSIPKESIVKIKVYDILGREIATLVNEQKSTGNYSVQFKGSSLSSGVYFYQIQAGDFVDTKKMILLK